MKAEYVDHMGDDLSVVNAARVSFDKTSEWVYSGVDTNGPAEKALASRDQKLINYLATHNHWTPFAHTAITIRMSAPVPIRTQCFKHKAGFTENEESRRYISSTPEVYLPEKWRKKADNKKQGSGGTFYSKNQAIFKKLYSKTVEDAIDTYDHLISQGVCPEQARFVLPQGAEVQWIWTGNLASYARFYKQRMDPHSQEEIQELALMVGEIIEPLFPVSWKALIT
ncbi:FAD-dependent thymidylate synthase [Roseibium alexandrii]|uniref:FAD-dependent thymidylate synthase n=1 Tax=Roseibium alexandrii (strain DSM 17067 / NCIMB 14079 / DFL-11) TaxID=244592 RepID=A0A5E8GSJ6_ROSAD|nr:FAD-dependent thymidylate synthase [Roseibium alexandrii]EEE42854.1 thymidylate synthase, flavin-dependent [Roseibium alexandrii DFL-11]